VAFYLLSQEVAKEMKVVQSGQGADEVFGGYSWYPPMRNAPGDGLERYREQFFDRSHAELDRVLTPAHRLERDESEEFVRRHFARPGAETPLDRALRLDALVMLVDDPVKRVDNMTMAWGLEARTPFLDHELVELAAACPPELKLAEGGKGILKRAVRRLLPAEVIDRPKGYFPVPALSHLDGPYLELAAEALRSPAARERGLFEPAYVDELLAAPNEQRTTLDGSKLWQLALLELWLSEQGL
jgi:asparagine synthase (glutamine-hydrolysing)